MNVRCIILKVDNLLLTNVYLPSHKIIGTENRPGRDILNDILDTITGVFDKFRENIFVCGGDFNCDSKMNDDKSRQFIYNPLETFRKRFNMFFTEDVCQCATEYTYARESLNQYSKIDYFLVSRDCCEDLSDYHVINSHDNFSDHFPIAIALSGKDKFLSNNYDTPIASHENSSNVVKYLRWEHGDTACYYELTRQSLSDVDDQLTALTQSYTDSHSHDIRNQINMIYTSIVEALNHSADSCIPRLKSNALKFWWDQEMDDLKIKSVTSFRAWQAAGKPRFGYIHDEMLKHKMTYRRAIKDKDVQRVVEVSNDLHECLIKKRYEQLLENLA